MSPSTVLLAWPLQMLTSTYLYIEKLTRRNAKIRNECSVAAYIMLPISIEKHGMRLFVLIKLCQDFSHLSQRFLLNKEVYMSKLSSQSSPLLLYLTGHAAYFNNKLVAKLEKQTKRTVSQTQGVTAHPAAKN